MPKNDFVSKQLAFHRETVGKMFAQLHLRLELPTSGPLVIESSSPGIGVRQMLSEVSKLLRVDPIFIEPRCFREEDVVADIEDLFDAIAADRSFLVIDGWFERPQVSEKILETLLAKRRPEQTIIILSVKQDGASIRDSLQKVCSGQAWRDIRTIHVWAPETREPKPAIANA